MSSKVVPTKYTVSQLLQFQNRVMSPDPSMIDILRSLSIHKGQEVAEPVSVQETPNQSRYRPKDKSSSKDGAAYVSPLAQGNEKPNVTTKPTSPYQRFNAQTQPKVEASSQRPALASLPKSGVPKRSMSFTPKESNLKENIPTVNVPSLQKPLQPSKVLPLTTPKAVKTAPALVSPAPVLVLVTPSSPPSNPSPSKDESPSPYKELSPSEIETDPHRLSQRQKQITYGYRTLGYLRYRLLVPRDKRRKEHPRTPRKEQVCSKRSWDGQVKKWRRELHKWDPAPDSGFEELLTADILETIFDGIPGITELIQGLKEKLAQGTLNQIDEEDAYDDTPHTSPLIQSVQAENTSVARTLVF